MHMTRMFTKVGQGILGLGLITAVACAGAKKEAEEPTSDESDETATEGPEGATGGARRDFRAIRAVRSHRLSQFPAILRVGNPGTPEIRT